MKPGRYNLAELLKEQLSPEELKPFKRVWCRVDEHNHWHVDNYSTASNGYPRFRDDDTGRMIVIQRAVWEALNGKFIPVKACIKHVCKHRDCVNPHHLRVKKRNLEDITYIRWRLNEIKAKKDKTRMVVRKSRKKQPVSLEPFQDQGMSNISRRPVLA